MAMTLRTDAQLDQALRALADAEGISRQEVVRRAVLERLARSSHHADVESSTAAMLDQWSDVLERLKHT